MVPNGVSAKLGSWTNTTTISVFDYLVGTRIVGRIYSQANLVSKLLRQMAKAWKADSG
jgi:hypothetical protein